MATDASADSILSVWQWQWGHLLGKVAVSILFLNMKLNVCLNLVQMKKKQKKKNNRI